MKSQEKAEAVHFFTSLYWHFEMAIEENFKKKLHTGVGITLNSQMPVYCSCRSKLCHLTSVFNRQANVRISSPISTCTFKCWLLGNGLVCYHTFQYLLFLSIRHWTDLWKSLPFCPLCIQLSYIVVDLLVWWGIRGIINDFRKRKLKLSPIAYFSTYHGSISHLPTGYMWSPHVVPKPNGKAYWLQSSTICLLL